MPTVPLPPQLFLLLFPLLIEEVPLDLDGVCIDSGVEINETSDFYSWSAGVFFLPFSTTRCNVILGMWLYTDIIVDLIRETIWCHKWCNTWCYKPNSALIFTLSFNRVENVLGCSILLRDCYVRGIENGFLDGVGYGDEKGIGDSHERAMLRRVDRAGELASGYSTVRTWKSFDKGMNRGDKSWRGLVKS